MPTRTRHGKEKGSAHGVAAGGIVKPGRDGRDPREAVDGVTPEEAVQPKVDSMEDAGDSLLNIPDELVPTAAAAAAAVEAAVTAVEAGLESTDPNKKGSNDEAHQHHTHATDEQANADAELAASVNDAAGAAAEAAIAGTTGQHMAHAAPTGPAPTVPGLSDIEAQTAPAVLSSYTSIPNTASASVDEQAVRVDTTTPFTLPGGVEALHEFVAGEVSRSGQRFGFSSERPYAGPRPQYKIWRLYRCVQYKKFGCKAKLKANLHQDESGWDIEYQEDHLHPPVQTNRRETPLENVKTQTVRDSDEVPMGDPICLEGDVDDLNEYVAMEAQRSGHRFGFNTEKPYCGRDPEYARWRLYRCVEYRKSRCRAAMKAKLYFDNKHWDIDILGEHNHALTTPSKPKEVGEGKIVFSTQRDEVATFAALCKKAEDAGKFHVIHSKLAEIRAELQSSS